MLNFYLILSLCFDFETASQHEVFNMLALISLCNQRLSGSFCLHFLNAGLTGLQNPSLFSLLLFKGCIVAFIKFFIYEQISY